jgi:hypothetical protein
LVQEYGIKQEILKVTSQEKCSEERKKNEEDPEMAISKLYSPCKVPVRTPEFDNLLKQMDCLKKLPSYAPKDSYL